MESKICPICEVGELVDRAFPSKFEHRGRTTTLMLNIGNCTACGSDLADSRHMTLNLNLALRFKSGIDFGAQAQLMPLELLRAIYSRNVKPHGKPARCWATKLARLRGRNRLPRGLYSSQFFI